MGIQAQKLPIYNFCLRDGTLFRFYLLVVDYSPIYYHLISSKFLPITNGYNVNRAEN